MTPRVLLFTTGPSNNKRAQFALKTFQDSGVEFHEIRNLARCVQDEAAGFMAFYIKDLFDFSRILSGDIFVFINNDCALIPEWKEIVLPAVARYGCAFSRRVDVKRFNRYLTLEDIRGKGGYIGADLAAFTPAWWERRRDEFPDVAIGMEGWDAALQWIMHCDGFEEIQPVCYHQVHSDSFWRRPSVLQDHPAQKEQRRRLIEWAEKNGLSRFLNSSFAKASRDESHGFVFKSGIFRYSEARPYPLPGNVPVNA